MTSLHETREEFVNIKGIPFDVDEGIAGRARIGLIVLASDHTVEHEFRQVVTLRGPDTQFSNHQSGHTAGHGRTHRRPGGPHTARGLAGRCGLRLHGGVNSARGGTGF